MASFRVELGPHAHPVYVGSNLLDQLGQLVLDAGLRGRRSALVSDTKVAPLYGARAAASLAAAGFEVAAIEVEAGEPSKSAATLERVYDRLADAGLDRSSTVFALGGGVVGDLAGYAAATFMRGIAVVQIPTTMTAQVDSALGGKTGINHRAAKNLIGAFHQPRAIIADVATLNSLPEREFREGLAEVIKYGAIMDAAMVASLEAAMPAILRRDPSALERIVEQSLRHKATVVAGDEHEGGLRKILNFGHTVGHALEASAGYGSFFHGEAVAIGMVCAARLSNRFAGLSSEEVDRLVRLIAAAGLPTSLPERWGGDDFERALKLDKKRSGAGVEFVLLDRLGHALTYQLGFDQIVGSIA